MNEPNRPVPTTPKPPMQTPSQFSAGPPKAAPQAKLPETKPQAAPTQAPRRKVRFELEVPKARSVSVVGTFNNWTPGTVVLASVGGTTWIGELSLPPGRYEYRFVVDGKWVEPPHAKAYVPNPHGSRNAVFEL